MADDAGDSRDAVFEALYDQAPCGYLSTLPDGTIVRANQTFLNWIQRPGESVVGQLRFQALLTVGAQIYYETHYAPLLQIQGFVSEIALEMRRPDGSVRPVVASARQLRDAAGEVSLHLVALFDSTDRRRYEKELLVARRRAEADAKALADVDRKKSEFIAVLAHELRNPLAPIRNGIEVLTRSVHGNATVAKATAMMQRQVAQMVRLVDDLLDASRVGQDKLTLRRLPVDLASVVRHAVEVSDAPLQAAGLTFQMVVPPAPIYVEADAARLIQAIGNVLNNAIKFTPRGGAVSLVVERSDAEALIRIRDTGIGIDEQQLSRVFELFMQAEQALDRRDGLGIGLMLAKSLVERHDGRITAHSDGLGTGAEFVIHLPTFAGGMASISPSRVAPPLEPRVTARRILVVDDNEDSAQMMALLLGAFGHDVQLAHDGLQAVEAAAAFEPHLILLDIGLPVLNGYDAAQRIRAQAKVQPMLVAVTGWGQEDDRRRSSAAGFDAHLVKPIEHNDLTRLIDDLGSDEPT